MIWTALSFEATSEQPRPRAAGGAGLGVLNARKTATAPAVMTEAWVRTHSIGRTGARRPACEAATAATADAACLGCGNDARTVVRVCIGRLSVVAGTARARWCSPFAVVCLAEHASPDLQLTTVASIQRLLGHAAWLCFSQIASQQLKRQQCTPASKSSRLEPVVCDCALTGNVPSTRAG